HAAPPGRPVLVEARVQRAAIVFRGKRQLVVNAEGLVLRFFHFRASQLAQFKQAIEEGLCVRAFGEVRRGLLGAEMAHPRYRFVAGGEPLPQSLTPVYPSSAGIGQGTLRAKVLEALDAGPLEDSVPPGLRAKHALPAFDESVRLLHRPPPGIDAAALVERTHPAWRRVKFDELLAQQLSLKLAYRKRRSRSAPRLRADGVLLKAFARRLPFKLTRAQTRTMNEVLRDLVQPHPMQRLLQGDVGSGKTVVAAIACLAAADSDHQAAVMAPTEILSEQHARKFNEWLEPLGIRIAWLHGSLSAGEKKRALTAIASGEAQIAIGTHALVQKGVEFRRLGLAVIDEQHRFGVQQRLTLRSELAALQVGLLHGRLSPAERSAVMQRFVAGEVQLLVCTTVIEVGVDVPNASLMVIESAERFGLAQLHQLRGRIGRGVRESVCILLFGDALSQTARDRLEIIFKSTDGF